MSVGELLAFVVGRLDDASIPHMVAGSFASTYHGEPRTTQDIDIVIAPTRDALVRFLGGLDPEHYYVDQDVALDALRRRSQFNLIDMQTGWKIDFIIRRDRAFSNEEFDRRISVELLGATVNIATPEDTVIAKLEWAKAANSERQLRDVRSVVDVTGDQLDREYIERWVAKLNLAAQWEKVLE